ncbi:MAG: tRNA (cytidine(34)-2'-O)-methyltransferase [Ilumatobacteraceae bacterium]
MLVRPEIATSTGNIIRLCANTGAVLHLVEPLGFSLDESRLRRAGLDYHELAQVHVHDGWAALDAAVPLRRFAFSSRSTRRYDQADLRPDDVYVFGAERAGLGSEELGRFDDEHLLRLPMRPGNRSLNLANAVAIVVYESWRRTGFDGEVPGGGGFAETLHEDSFDP